MMDAQKMAERLLEGVDRIAEIATEGEQVLAKSYGAGKWTGIQLVAHLGDVDAVFYQRLCRAIAEPGSKVESFDENLWAEKLGTNERPLEISIGLITATREAMAHILRSTPTPALVAGHVVKDGKKLTVGDLMDKVAAHGEHHLGQLEAIRDGRLWTKKT
jgi:hypothetical protein